MLLNAFGTLSSPGYPHINQEPRSCVWKISVSSGEVIILTVKDFDMETSWNCETDFMEIRDGHGPPSKLIGRYCGNNKPPTQITSTGNRLWIKLRLNGFSRRKGFFFDYKGKYQNPKQHNH